MAIAFDNASTAVGTGVASIQWTHTVGGANTYIVAGHSGFGLTASSVVANGVGMTRKGLAASPASTFTTLWSRAGVATGAITMSCTTAGGGTDFFAIGAVSYTGVAQATPDGNASTATGTASNINFSISSTANAWVIGTFGGQSITAAVVTDAGSQNRRFQAVGSEGTYIILSDKIASGTPTSMSWTSTGTLGFAAVGVAFSATAIAASALVYTLSMLGVGA